LNAFDGFRVRVGQIDDDAEAIRLAHDLSTGLGQAARRVGIRLNVSQLVGPEVHELQQAQTHAVKLPEIVDAALQAVPTLERRQQRDLAGFPGRLYRVRVASEDGVARLDGSEDPLHAIDGQRERLAGLRPVLPARNLGPITLDVPTRIGGVRADVHGHQIHVRPTVPL
jgi:hypothetical protein